MNTWTRVRLALCAGLALSLGGCLVVGVDHDVNHAAARFDRAYREIARLEKEDPGRRCTPHWLCILVLDRDEQSVVRVSVPMWLVKLGLDMGARGDADGHDFNYRKRYDLDWKAVRDLDRYGRGLLVALEEKRDKVLIWLR